MALFDMVKSVREHITTLLILFISLVMQPTLAHGKVLQSGPVTVQSLSKAMPAPDELHLLPHCHVFVVVVVVVSPGQGLDELANFADHGPSSPPAGMIKWMLFADYRGGCV
jgi:hypothetical protein